MVHKVISVLIPVTDLLKVELVVGLQCVVFLGSFITSAIKDHYKEQNNEYQYMRHISLILDYQFCACVMRTSGVPQLQVIRMERLYGYK